jgi:predicted transcriptional regulator
MYLQRITIFRMGKKPRDETLLVRLPSALKRRLQRAADGQDETMTALVLRGVVAEVERAEKAKEKDVGR